MRRSTSGKDSRSTTRTAAERSVPVSPPARSPASSPATRRPASGSSAAAAKPGSLQLLEHLLRGQFEQRLLERHVPVARDVLVDALGVDHPAVSQGDAHLLSVERNLGVVGHRCAGLRLPVREAVDNAPLDQSLLNQLGRIGGGDATIEDALWVDGDHRAHGTEAAAPCFQNLHLIS